MSQLFKIHEGTSQPSTTVLYTLHPLSGIPREEGGATNSATHWNKCKQLVKIRQTTVMSQKMAFQKKITKAVFQFIRCEYDMHRACSLGGDLSGTGLVDEMAHMFMYAECLRLFN